MDDAERILRGYPGRGVAVARKATGELGWLYFLTGRSLASHDRRIVVSNDRLMVVPSTNDGESDPLRHYACAVPVENGVVIGNGDHVEFIATAVGSGATLEDAAAALEPEPDPPIYTPRIAVVMTSTTAHAVRVIASDPVTIRDVFDVAPRPASLVVVTTYDGDFDKPTGSAPVTSLELPAGLEPAEYV